MCIGHVFLKTNILLASCQYLHPFKKSRTVDESSAETITACVNNWNQTESPLGTRNALIISIMLSFSSKFGRKRIEIMSLLSSPFISF